MIDFSAFVVVPATVVDGVRYSAVLVGGSEFGVATLIKGACPGVSLGEAVDIAEFIVVNSGRSVDSLRWLSGFYRRYDTAVRQAWVNCLESLCSL